MNTQQFLEILSAMRQRIEAEKDYLTDLDNAIGDGDHGINLAKGFAAVGAKLPQFAGQNFGAILKTVGMTLVSAVGGSSGALYGTAFMKAGVAMTGKETMEMSDFLVCMKAAVEGIMMRGRSVQGEKTMLDAMIPALSAMEKAYAGGLTAKKVLEAGVEAAKDGVEYTKTIIATKGRASYIGERSLGHQDPGATSFASLLDAAAGALQGEM